MRSFRFSLYGLARLLGDINAVRRDAWAVGSVAALQERARAGFLVAYFVDCSSTCIESSRPFVGASWKIFNGASCPTARSDCVSAQRVSALLVC